MVSKVITAKEQREFRWHSWQLYAVGLYKVITANWIFIYVEESNFITVFLILGAAGVTIEFVNGCQFPVWPAGTQVNGTLLNTGETSKVQITPNSTYGSFWGRTGCSFGSDCTTGDCEGVLNC